MADDEKEKPEKAEEKQDDEEEKPDKADENKNDEA